MAEQANEADLVKEISELRRRIDELGNSEREAAKGINTDALAQVLNASGQFDAPAWQGLSVEERSTRRRGLIRLRDILSVIIEQDGPTHPKHIMKRAFPSNPTVLGASLFSLLLIGALLFRIAQLWEGATGSKPASPTDLRAAISTAHQALAADAALDPPPPRPARAPNVAAPSARALAHKPPLPALVVPVLASASPEATSTHAGASSAASGPEVAPPPAPGERLPVEPLEHEPVSASQGAVPEPDQDAKDAARVRVSDALEKVREALTSAPSERTVLVMVMYIGALGGALHALASLMFFIGNRQLRRSWVLFYLSLPFRGAALAVLVCLLLRVGLLSPPNGDGTDTAALNLLGVYAIAGLTGMFSEKATDKLAEVFSTLFRTQATSKDKVEVS